jgi:hypothetical protein
MEANKVMAEEEEEEDMDSSVALAGGRQVPHRARPRVRTLSKSKGLLVGRRLWANRLG